MNVIKKLQNKLNKKLVNVGFTKNELQFIGMYDFEGTKKELQSYIYKSKSFYNLVDDLCSHLDYIHSVSSIQRY